MAKTAEPDAWQWLSPGGTVKCIGRRRPAPEVHDPEPLYLSPPPAKLAAAKAAGLREAAKEATAMATQLHPCKDTGKIAALTLLSINLDRLATEADCEAEKGAPDGD